MPARKPPVGVTIGVAIMSNLGGSGVLEDLIRIVGVA
jgi:hypothetical protein